MLIVSTTLFCILEILALSEVGAEFDSRQLMKDRYRAVSAAIVAKDLNAIVAIGYREGSDVVDDLRNQWQARFNAAAPNLEVEFELLDVERSGDDLIAEVNRRVFYESGADSVRPFELSRSRDRWRRRDGQWMFLERSLIGATTTGQTMPDRQPESPRLRQVQAAVGRGDLTSVATFWSEVKGKCPIVELIDDEPQMRLVTFVWRHEAGVERIEVRGGPSESSREPFDRLPGTDIWYHTERLASDSRYTYGLVVRGRVPRDSPDSESGTVLVETYPLDPNNPSIFNAGPVLELPDAPKDSWYVQRNGIPRGHLQYHEFYSAILGEKRSVRAYVSALRDPRDPPRVLVMFLDGEDCNSLMSLPTTLDNLVADGRIPPVVALLVDSQGTRGRDLVFHDPFVSFLADELVPWAASEFNTRFVPDRTVIGGMSLGGLTSAYAACQRPDVFGNVLSQSGSFWRRRPDPSPSLEGWLPGEVARRYTPQAKFYLEVGRYEAAGMVENNRRMRDVLIAKGAQVTYSEYNGGHDHVNWRVSVGNGLIALLGDP